jgi:hypothetical protein
MRDCPNAEMRDALPDLMHGTLPPQRLAAVRAHVDGCDACRAELALLGRIRDSVSTPALAGDRIVAALPRYQRQTTWQRFAGGRAVRVAAAVVLVAGGATLALRKDASEPGTVVAGAAPRAVPTTELALGESFADVSDSALVALVDAIDDLEATLSEEPEPITVPLAPVEGL